MICPVSEALQESCFPAYDDGCEASLTVMAHLFSLRSAAGILGIALITGPSSLYCLPSYKGIMQIPVDVYTEGGVRLEKGLYELEVRQQGTDHVLVFSTADGEEAVVKQVIGEDSGVEAAEIPLVGTHYMRSSDEPVLTAFERRMSKTGAPRYQEETRDWKAAIRVYRSRTGDTVFFTFQARQEHGQWSRSHFRLLLSAPPGR